MKMPLERLFFVAAAIAASNLAVAEELHTFKRIQLSDQFWSEGANFGDLNNDGVNDVISGPWWWEGPDFKTRHEYYPAKTTFQLKLGPQTSVTVPGFEGTLGKENKYSDNFFAWAYDFNSDGWKDILIIGFPGRDTSWFENPKGGHNHWVRHKVFDQTDNESPTFADLTGDGKPELVCITKGQYGYAEPDWSNPAKPWRFHPISPNNKYGNFTHGMGVGDVNGDGRLDLLEKNGWWEQPASLAGDPVWNFHKQPMGAGGSQMYAYDVNGDGLNDIITALAAHEFGLAWYEQYREGTEVRFREHVIMNREPKDNKYGVKFSEIHAIDLVDMDADGVKDIVTGKRFWSHGRTGDPDRNDAAVLYWFKLVRNVDKSVDFIPYLIDNESGVGTQVATGDINGDGMPDIVVGNKKGTFVHLHEKKIVSRDEWQKAQPKVFSASTENIPAVVYQGETGPGRGKHIVFLAGDHEYRSEETLPALARIMAKHYGFKCSVFFTTNPQTGFIEPGSSHIAGLDALKTADLMVVFLRFQDFPDAEMQHVVDYLDRGGPIVGFRTSTHAFQIKRPDAKFLKYTWKGGDETYPGGFGRQILGETWVSHYGRNHKQSSRLILQPNQVDHPILRGVRDVWVQSGGYTADPIEGSTVLALGQILDGMTPDSPPARDKKEMPVAWYRTYQGKAGKTGRVFTTTHGASEDLLNDGFRRMAVNAVLWAAGLESSIRPDSDISFVGPFQPTTFAFDGYVKEMKPADMAGWDAPIPKRVK